MSRDYKITIIMLRQIVMLLSLWCNLTRTMRVRQRNKIEARFWTRSLRRCMRRMEIQTMMTRMKKSKVSKQLNRDSIVDSTRKLDLRDPAKVYSQVVRGRKVPSHCKLCSLSKNSNNLKLNLFLKSSVNFTRCNWFQIKKRESQAWDLRFWTQF